MQMLQVPLAMTTFPGGGYTTAQYHHQRRDFVRQDGNIWPIIEEDGDQMFLGYISAFPQSIEDANKHLMKVLGSKSAEIFPYVLIDYGLQITHVNNGMSTVVTTHALRQGPAHI
jgi:hypothetical protein